MTEELVLRAYASMINTLDSSKLLPLLPDDFHYASQSVFDEITSKEEFSVYIDAKLKTIRDTKSKVWAEMGRFQGRSLYNQQCVLIAQGAKDEIVGAIVAEVVDGKVLRLDMCTVAPHPSSAVGSGDYPA